MKKFIKTLVPCVLAGTMAFSLAGCGGSKETPEQKEETATEEKSGEKETLYIYNSKGENAEQFQAMADAYGEQNDINVKVFSIGSGQDHMETLNAEMISQNPPAIFSIQGYKELTNWVEGGFALNFNNADNAEFVEFAKTIDPSLTLTYSGSDSYGIPYNIEGYGYIVDTQMLADLFAEGTDVNTLISDIKEASYDEWEKLVLAIDAHIDSPTGEAVTLNSNEYTLKGEKAGLAEKLTGVFAVMGSQKWTYGDHFVNVGMNAHFESSTAVANASDEEIQAMENSLVNYAKALDLKTSYVADFVRGQDFISEANTGYDQTIEIFANSKAVFFKQGNWAFGGIQNSNAEVANRLEFLPVKMPMTDADMVSGKTVQQFNSSIPVFVPNYYAINAKVDQSQQQLAMEFLLWLNTTEEGQKYVVEEFNFIPYNIEDPSSITLPNSLGNSILGYFAEGKTLGVPYHGAPGEWSGNTFGLYLLENYMNKETWTEEDYKTIANEAVTSLVKMRNE